MFEQWLGERDYGLLRERDELATVDILDTFRMDMELHAGTIQVPAEVLMWDPCLVGSPETLTIAHLVVAVVAITRWVQALL